MLILYLLIEYIDITELYLYNFIPIMISTAQLILLFLLKYALKIQMYFQCVF